AGAITTVVARGNCSGSSFSTGGVVEGVLAADARLHDPYGIAVGPDGSIFIIDRDYWRIRQAGTDGRVRTVAGSGAEGHPIAGSLAVTSPLLRLLALDVDGRGEVYFTSDQAGGDTRVLKIDSAGYLRTVAGVATDPST